MDISTPHADVPQGRILCLHPDGRLTVFADHLYAVFGLQYLEGKLYVLHNPRFSVFVDDHGVGKQRVDLIETTNPRPWALDWNDHVPANFRLAMDGYFYMAVGDKGVYGAVGRDGKAVELHGGGILRLRPDGTELEVMSTGTRNILDVAVNAEDEVFTYDNTDEQNWMSRLTHMVDGGFYGYPYDFLPRRPYTLWCMADYGGGAATGTFAYNEDALPAEYHGNLFLADYGKRQLLRVAVQRAGGTYEVVTRQDFFPDPPGDFRPVGIGLAPDGLSIYLCDWNHADAKENVVVGRLFKLSYTGASRAVAKPAWYLPAALGQPCTADIRELLEGFRHPAQSVRLTAQRRLVERGPAALPALQEVLSNPQVPALARCHALWAADAMDQGRGSRSAILAAAQQGDAVVRRQAIRQLGTRRVRDAAPVLVGLLRDPDASIRFQAATALGRIADPAAISALQMALAEKDLFAHFAIFTALHRIGLSNPSAWPMIVAGLAHDAPAIREGTRFALRDTYVEALVSALSAFVANPAQPDSGRTAALELLVELQLQPPAWKGEWWAYHPVNAPPPAKTQPWPATHSIQEVLRARLDDPSPALRRVSIEGLLVARDASVAPLFRSRFSKESGEVRLALIRAFGVLKDREAGSLLRQVLEDPQADRAQKAEAIAAAEGVGGPELAQALNRLVGSSAREPELRARAIRALGSLKAAAAVPALAQLADHPDADLRAAAQEALVQIGNSPAFQALQTLSTHRQPDLRREGVAALGNLQNREAVPRLLEALRDPEVRGAALLALTQIPDARAVPHYLEGLTDARAEVRDKCQRALARIRDAALPTIEAQVARLPADVVAQLRQIYKDHATAKTSRLFTTPLKVPTPADYIAYVRTHAGQPERGKALFFDKEALGCLKCHRVNGTGGEIGPDLSTIGTQFSREQLAENVLFPSQSIREGYQQVIVTTRAGRVIAGLVRSESSETVTLRDSDGKDHTIRKVEIEDRTNSKVSLMPEGLQVGLPLERFADLIAYLHSLDGRSDRRKSP